MNLKIIKNKIASLNLIDNNIFKNYKLRKNDICKTNNGYLIVVYFTYVFLFDSNLNIDKYNHLDCELWEIYNVQKDYYLIYGEMDVYKIDNNLNVIFQVGAQDVLYNPDVKKSFILNEDNFEIYDFLGNHFIYNFDGLEIKNN